MFTGPIDPNTLNEYGKVGFSWMKEHISPPFFIHWPLGERHEYG